MQFLIIILTIMKINNEQNYKKQAKIIKIKIKRFK